METDSHFHRSKKVKAALAGFAKRELPVIRDLIFFRAGPAVFSGLIFESVSRQEAHEILMKAVELGLVIRTTEEGSGQQASTPRECFQINADLRREIEENLLIL